jgi:hypothetical protein
MPDGDVRIFPRFFAFQISVTVTIYESVSKSFRTESI